MIRSKWVAAIVFLTLSVSVAAKDLGNYGQTYNIIEIDMIEWLKHKFAVLQEKGVVDKVQKDFVKETKKRAITPKPVKGLTTTSKPLAFFVDPTETTTKNLYKANGDILVKKGTTINPFRRLAKVGRPYKWHWAFFDATDKRQIRWAKDILDLYPESTKLVLIKGNINQAYKELNHKIYFDQKGIYTTKLRVKHIPTLAYEKNFKWLIQEFDIGRYHD